MGKKVALREGDTNTIQVDKYGLSINFFSSSSVLGSTVSKCSI